MGLQPDRPAVLAQAAIRHARRGCARSRLGIGGEGAPRAGDVLRVHEPPERAADQFFRPITHRLLEGGRNVAEDAVHPVDGNDVRRIVRQQPEARLAGSDPFVGAEAVGHVLEDAEQGNDRTRFIALRATLGRYSPRFSILPDESELEAATDPGLDRLPTAIGHRLAIVRMVTADRVVKIGIEAVPALAMDPVDLV